MTEVIGVEVLTSDGGRVDWSQDGEWIAFDRPGDDGLHDVWRMRPDGTESANLTPVDVDLGLPDGGKGNPAWHPDGDWMVIQVERAGHPGPIGGPAAHPGAGFFNDLWLLRRDGSEARPWIELPTDRTSGALHPHFAEDGSRLVFASLAELPTTVTPQDRALPEEELERKLDRSITTMFGAWTLATVDLSGVEDWSRPNPRRHEVAIEGRPCFLEAHHALSDGKVLVSANALPFQAVVHHNVLVVDGETGAIQERVTTAPDEWTEHAHPGRAEPGRLVFNSSRDLRPNADYPYAPGSQPFSSGMPPRSDLWVREPDGTHRRLTYFNDPGWLHALADGRHVFVSDFGLSPDGSQIVAAIHRMEPPPFVRGTSIALLTLAEPL